MTQGGERAVDVTGRALALRPVELERFFHPRTVAVIGASPGGWKPNSLQWRKVKAWADASGARAIPVHPVHDEVDGERCVRSVLDIDEAIDLAVILVGDAVDAFEEVVRAEAAFAVIFSAGFAESGPDGQARQARLDQLLQRGPTRLLGPNTNLNAFEQFRTDLDGDSIALITQSGHQGRPVVEAQQFGVKLSHWAPVGNEADLEFADFASYFAGRPGTGAIAAYIEGFSDGRSLLLAADRAAAARVPIVVVKVGRRAEGASMAASHTGHLTGRDRVVDAAFDQYGIARVDGLDELTDVATMFARTARRSFDRGPNVCVYSMSGGTGAHAADLCATAGLQQAPLSEETQRTLHQWIPDYLRVSNPVDSGGPPAMDERGRKILDALVADPDVDLLICPIAGAVPAISAPLARDLVAVAETTDTPIFVVWGSPDIGDPVYTDVLCASRRLVLFRTLHNCVQAAKAYADHGAFQARARSPFEQARVATGPAANEVSRLLEAGERTLSEHASKQVVAAYGIPTIDDVLCADAAGAVVAANELGFPVVVKVSAPDLPHRSDLGLVRLDVRSADEVASAHDELLAIAARAAPDAAIEGVLVGPQLTGGVECVVGTTNDELFGPVVMFGLGGVLVEVLDDVAFLVPPFGRAEAERAVRSVRGFPLLDGARGAPPADLDALVDVILHVQDLALDHAGTIAELDLNPVLVRPVGQGAIALDALVVRT